MIINTNIEVCVKENQSLTEKGQILEELVSHILRIQQYQVLKTVRLTGMEVDVYAIHKVNNSQIYVECKAWADPLPADTITKLLGNVTLNNISAGWLVTTGPLSKDTKGIVTEWESRVATERARLSFYTPDRIIDMLSDAKIIVSADSVTASIPDTYTTSQNMTLLLLPSSMVWVVPVTDKDTGITSSVVAFDAKTGKRIAEKQRIEELKQYKSSFSALTWLSDQQKPDSKYIAQLQQEYDSIVPVVSGEDWTDYRPARPEDFVGRKQLILSIFDFFDNVNAQKTSTRLFAIKAPSGMGKSSVVLKIISVARRRKLSKKYYVYAVDVRTAMSARYAELVLKACFEKAAKDGFIPQFPKVEYSNLQQYIESDSIRECLEYLSTNSKTIILIFDQFEELFSKKELYSLFDNVRMLCNLIDSLQGQLVLGFAWKTDLTIPAEHPAYYMWTNLADRRKEFELGQFQVSEIKSAINLFGNQLGERINPILNNYLTKQCQGYPWLLKKLCIHVFKLIQEGGSQDSVIGQRLNIVELFEKDIAGLTAEQHACLIEIARNSPADFFSISELYGNDLVQALINQRLVIRRASKLTLYWDIFRDYVINKTVPTLVLDYIPQQQFASIIRAMRCLLDQNNLTVDALAKKAGVKNATIDNIMIDAVMFGLVQKAGGIISLQPSTEDELLILLQSFFRKHIIYQKVFSLESKKISFESYQSLFYDLYSENNLKDKTKSTYCSKLLNWFICLGLFGEQNGQIIVNNAPNLRTINVDSNSNRKRLRVRYGYNGTSLFWGQSSPERMETVYNLIKSGEHSYKKLKSAGYRNAIELLSAAQALQKDDDYITLKKTLDEIYTYISHSETIRIAKTHMDANRNLKGADMGRILNAKFYRNWTDGSMIRYGTALMTWVRHLEAREVQFQAYNDAPKE